MVVVGGRLYIVGEFNFVNGVERPPRRGRQHDQRRPGHELRPVSGRQGPGHRRQSRRQEGVPGRQLILGDWPAPRTWPSSTPPPGRSREGRCLKQVNDLVEDLIRQERRDPRLRRHEVQQRTWTGTPRTGRSRVGHPGRWRHAGRAVQQRPGLRRLPRRLPAGDVTLRLLALAPSDGDVDPTFHPIVEQLPGRVLPGRRRALPRRRWVLLDDGRCRGEGPRHLPEGLMC